MLDIPKIQKISLFLLNIHKDAKYKVLLISFFVPF